MVGFNPPELKSPSAWNALLPSSKRAHVISHMADKKTPTIYNLMTSAQRRATRTCPFCVEDHSFKIYSKGSFFRHVRETHARSDLTDDELDQAYEMTLP
jgi:hypothetical protein